MKTAPPDFYRLKLKQKQRNMRPLWLIGMPAPAVGITPDCATIN
jgi:hypothetical protein